jgi:hypothetical protein
VTTSHQKGKALEMAVYALESAILRQLPGYNENTFHIAGNKIISIGGVHHEIDIWVNVDRGSGYSANFIFECKNRAVKVNKNDIVVFGEKIRATQAQIGFLVARSFTRDAEAQASTEPRIQLLRVRELPVDEVPVPIQRFHGIAEVEGSRQSECRVICGSEQGSLTGVDLGTAHFTIDGEEQDLGAYLKDWINEEISKRQKTFRSESVAEGVYPLAFDASRVFSDREVAVNHDHVAQMALSGKLEMRVVHGTIVSRFDVATRGRIFQCLVQFPNGASVTMHQWAVLPK